MAYEAVAQDAHEAGQHDEVRRESVDALAQRGVEGVAVGKGSVVHTTSGYTGLLRSFQPRRRGPVADHGGNSDRQGSRSAGGDQRLHVAAATGNENDNFLHVRNLRGERPWLRSLAPFGKWSGHCGRRRFSP